jgi:hypothetical protein
MSRHRKLHATDTSRLSCFSFGPEMLRFPVTALSETNVGPVEHLVPMWVVIRQIMDAGFQVLGICDARSLAMLPYPFESSSN